VELSRNGMIRIERADLIISECDDCSPTVLSTSFLFSHYGEGGRTLVFHFICVLIVIRIM